MPRLIHPTIEGLASLWQRVLGLSTIGVEDNFFGVGGNPTSANRLFSEIAKEFGRELSPLTIYHAPTIAKLAAVLNDPALPRFATLVPMRAGTKEPPVFMVPGLGGTVMEFFHLVSHIESERPLYGLQSRGMDGFEEPFDRVEDLARFYLDAVRARQPKGPYALVGYSLGGLVALEMAHRLSENGEKVALLALVEAYPHRSHLPLSQNGRIVRRLAKRLILKTLRRAGINLPDPQHTRGDFIDGPEVGPTFTPVMGKAIAIAYLAWQRYKPRYYKGRINFVKRSEIESRFPDDPIAVWSKLTDELAIEKVPGSHLEVLSIHYRSLAGVISRYLNEMPCGDAPITYKEEQYTCNAHS